MAKRERKETKKSSGFFGKLLCIVLGFILGVVGTIGGIVGAGYALVTQVTIKDAMNTVNNLAGTSIDYSEYVSEEYADQTVWGMIGVFGEVASEFQNGTGSFNTLAKISPMVRKGVEALTQTIANYGVHVDADTLMETPITELAPYLMDTVNSIEIASLLETVTGNPATGIIALLCYGEEGVHYVTETNDAGDTVIRMLGTNTTATIGKLTGEGGITELLGGLSFAALLDATGGMNTDDTIMRTLLYGELDKDYTVAADGSVQPLPITYTYSSQNDTFVDKDGNVFTKSGLVWKSEDGLVISTDTNDGNAYDYSITDEGGCIIYQLALDEDKVYHAYVDDVMQYRRGLLIGDLLGEGADLTDIIGTIRLGDLLNLDGTSDAIMLSVAYGEEGKDYTIDRETNKIIPLNNADSKAPTTIGDLLSGDGMSLVENISLAAVLGIDSPLDESVEPLLIMLAYGEEGVNYEKYTENGVQKWRWLTDSHGEPYNARTIKQLIDSDDNLFNDLTLATVLNVVPSSDKIVIALAYGTEGVHYRIENGGFVMLEQKYTIQDGKAYDDTNSAVGTAALFRNAGSYSIYKVTLSDGTVQYVRGNNNDGYVVYPSQRAANEQTDALKYEKTKLSDLRGANAAKKLENIAIGTALGVDPLQADSSDPLLLAIAYGNEGQHYTISNNTIVWATNPETGLPYRPRTLGDMKNAETIIGEITLETALGLTYQSPAILLSLAYGKGYTIDANNVVHAAAGARLRTIADLKGNNGNSIINEIELRSILSSVDTDDTIMMFMIYGQQGVHYNASGSSVSMLQMQFAVYGNNAYDVYGNNVGTSSRAGRATINGVNYTLATASGRTVDVNVGTASAPNTQTLTLYYAETSAGAAYYSPRCIGDWSDENNTMVDDMMKALTLADCLGADAVSGSDILKNLADTPLSNLVDEIEALPLQDALAADVYTHGGFVVQNGKYVYSTASNAELLPAIAVNNGGTTTYVAVYAKAVTKVAGQTHYEYYDYRNVADPNDDVLVGDTPLKDAWKYLLVDHATTQVVDGVTYKMERVYALNCMNDALQNMTENMQDASLNDLHNDGIISFDGSNENGDFRGHDITYELKIGLKTYPVTSEIVNGEEVVRYYYYADGTKKTKIGELTVRELLGYAGDMVAFLDKIKTMF